MARRNQAASPEGVGKKVRSTVVYALGELTAEGLIESKVGKGTVVANNTWGLLAAAPPPDWHRYVKAGTYEPNKPFIQQINKAEVNPDIIRLGTGELSPELLPAEHIRNIFQNCPRKITLGYSEPKGSQYLREVISDYVNYPPLTTLSGRLKWGLLDLSLLLLANEN